MQAGVALLGTSWCVERWGVIHAKRALEMKERIIGGYSRPVRERVRQNETKQPADRRGKQKGREHERTRKRSSMRRERVIV